MYIYIYIYIYINLLWLFWSSVIAHIVYVFSRLPQVGIFNVSTLEISRSQWPRGTRQESAAACLLAGIVGSNPTMVMDVCLL